jgi:hypothetical protein
MEFSARHTGHPVLAKWPSKALGHNDTIIGPEHALNHALVGVYDTLNALEVCYRWDRLSDRPFVGAWTSHRFLCPCKEA